MRTNFVTILAFLIAMTTFAQKQQPNIIMIAVDDLNDWIGVYGVNPHLITPNMNKLAQKAKVFRMQCKMCFSSTKTLMPPGRGFSSQMKSFNFIRVCFSHSEKRMMMKWR